MAASVSTQHHHENGAPKKNTMSKLKTMFGGSHGSTNSTKDSKANNKHHLKSNPSSHDSSRANTPPQTPVLAPDVAHLGNLPRQPSSTNILSASLMSKSTNSSQKTSPAPSIHSSTTPPSTFSRIVVFDDGAHEHHLKSTRRQEKLGGMLRELLGNGKKVRDDAISAMPEFVEDSSSKSDSGTASNNNNNDLSLMSGLVSQIQNGEKDIGKVVRNGHGAAAPAGTGNTTPNGSTTNCAAAQSLVQKYGKCQEVIGKGACGIVRIAHKFDQTSRKEMLFAVKEFKRKPSEDAADFSKRLASEFCISSSLHHLNIIHTLDLMKDARGECCEVMEYCAGGDLYSLILASDGGLDVMEADCFFKQIMKGVVYMHSMGVAHCDLKPENLLLTCNGIVKISDFGNGECFRMAWETQVHMSSGVCGSRPYIAPEEFRDDEYDPRAVDIWATGVIYMAMRTGSYLWQVAIPDEDEFYRQYLTGRKQSNGYEPIESLKRSRCRNVIYSILDPIPSRRITGKQVLNSEWGRSIQLCEAAANTASATSGGPNNSTNAAHTT